MMGHEGFGPALVTRYEKHAFRKNFIGNVMISWDMSI